MSLKEVAKNLHPRFTPMIELIRRERPYRTPKGFIKWDVLIRNSGDR